MRAYFLLSLASLLAACSGGGSSNDNGGGGPAGTYVAWERVPAKFHPKIMDDDVNLANAQKVDMDLLSFDRDVRVIYAKELEPGQAILRRFTVWGEMANFGRLYTQVSGDTLSLGIDTGGQWSSCDIRVVNGDIAALKGACYVRIELVLPLGSQVEVYNKQHLLSRHFIAMSNAEFLQKYGPGLYESQSKVIDDYLDSYQAAGKTPSLSAHELGQVIGNTAFKNDALTTLVRLGPYVADRDHLEDEVVAKFMLFDQNDVRRALGLPEKKSF